ncbi:MAG TPA: hypothetical protein VJM12_07220 [Pyrinomonadaceae bacterium]|nr:hypothetical protein [Pyrinomonadaceae bacterium]
MRTVVEFGDVLIFFYALVFVRQYLWIIDNNLFAWALSVGLTAICWYFYISTKQFQAERFGRSFWLVVGLPLIGAYLLRAAFLDHSFDVLSYHLLHAERSLRGPLFTKGDFFPTAMAFNPAPDTLAGISRLFLGFRLGTIINLFAILWAAQIVDKLLRPFVKSSWLRSACVLVVMAAEHLFFEISTYMIDLLALPLMLEATLLTLRLSEAQNQRANFIHIGLLLGASTAFKLTNLAIALPIVIICAYQSIRSRGDAWKPLISTALIAAAAFLAPLLPFTVYIWQLTGNPVFPAANVFFKSPYWPTHGGWDSRFGPNTIWETILWPVLIWFVPERHSELAVYSGRLSIGFVVALIGLILMWRVSLVRNLCFILVTSTLLWSAVATGNARYGFYQEVLSGLTVIAVAVALVRQTSELKFSWKSAVAGVLCVTLVIQAVLACSYIRHNAWGSRDTIIANPRTYLQNARFMLRDRQLETYLTNDQLAVFDGVRVWAEACPQSTAFQVLLKPNVPIIAARQPEYFFTRDSRKQFVRMVEELPSGQMFALCLREYLGSAREAIAARGLEIGRITPVELPFFSPDNRIGLILIEVLRPVDNEARQKFQSSWMNAAFPDSDYREQIVALNAPSVMRPGEKVTVRFKIKNLGYSTWPAVGNKEGRYQVNLRNRWLNADGTGEVNSLDGGTAMQADLAPGKEAELPLTITAPSVAGEFIVEVDMVHEGVTWFYERGATSLRLRVRVEP